MPNHIFKFKQFAVYQEKSAMKVGTDGVLLGAWANVEGAKSILDIGTGTGLIALMAAQRNKQAVIHAVEIDDVAYNEAYFNVGISEWKDRIKLFHQAFEGFSNDHVQEYDHLICNPPFFKSGPSAPNLSRMQARQSAALPHEVLLAKATLVMKQDARFSLILPEKEGKEFISLAALKGFFVARQTTVYSKPQKPAERLLLELSKNYHLAEKSELIIYDNDNNYTDEYKHLTRPFYLNF